MELDFAVVDVFAAKPFAGNPPVAAIHALVEWGELAGLLCAPVTQRPGRGYSGRIAGQCRTTVRGRRLV